jgi:outer membrane protein assembly factor BamB
MMRRSQRWPAALCFAIFFSLADGVVSAQSGRSGNWPVVGGNAQHTGWQKDDARITKDAMAGEFKFEWKLKLGKDYVGPNIHTEPLLISHLMTSHGSKDLLLVGGENSLYAIDYELGTVFWEKRYDLPPSGRVKSKACNGASISLVLNPPPNYKFDMTAIARGASRFPPSPAEIPVAQRHIGNENVRGVYVLTGDGYLHEQILFTGADYAPAVRFLPAPDDNVHSLTRFGRFVYTTSGRNCASTSSGIWRIDLSTPALSVSANTDEVNVLGMEAPAISADGTVYISTGSGVSDPGTEIHANSVIALTSKELKVKDWYTPSDGSMGRAMNITPIAFAYKGKDVVAATVANGRMVLLDSESLGGPDHHTPLAQTPAISISKKSGAWGRLAGWVDQEGEHWVLASLWGPVAQDVKLGTAYGSAPHGSIVAFKVEEKDGQILLTPGWVSRDLAYPAPPVIANGVVFALSGGDRTTRARLYAFDGETGKELYSSGDAIGTYAQFAAISLGAGHVFFTTHDNTLYSFGNGLEH